MSYIIHVREQKTNHWSQFFSSLSSSLSLFFNWLLESLMKEHYAIAIITFVFVIEFLESFAFVCFKMLMLETDSSWKKILFVKLLNLIHFHIILLLKEFDSESFALLICICFDSSEQKSQRKAIEKVNTMSYANLWYLQSISIALHDDDWTRESLISRCLKVD